MGSSVNVKQYVRQTFGELAKAEKIGDFERCLKICSKILKFAPNDVIALQCKIVSLAQLQQFEEALVVIKKSSSLSKLCIFEKAYCEYRLGRSEDALKTLNSADADDFRCLELKAQLLYRLDRHQESYELYLSLLKNSDDGFDDERQANLSASFSQLAYTEDVSHLKYSPALSTYEQLYNDSCRLCALGQFENAQKCLKKAEKLCREMLAEDDLGDEEIEDEVCCIKIMQAYCHQVLGKNDEAMKIYADVSKQKPSDVTLSAVIANNVVSVKKETNLFDARKKMKSCQSASLVAKLSALQRKIVCYNTLLVNLHSNQHEPSKKGIEELRTTHGADDLAVLCEATLLHRQKDPVAAVQKLESFAAQCESQKCPISVYYAVLQILVGEGKIGQALNKLNAWPRLQNLPGVQSLLVALCLANDDLQTAIDTLTATAEQIEKTTPNDPLLVYLLDECASLYTSSKDLKSAALYLERLRKLRPDDVNVLSRLINTCVKFDSEKAEKLSRDLPDFARLTEELDVDTLENAEFLSFGARYGAKKAAKVEAATPKVDEANLIAQKKRRPKKRKIKLPKKLDRAIPPDPERWLPKFERSTYKKRKDKRAKDRDIGRGTQGAVSGSTELDSSNKPDVSSNPTSPKPSTPAAAQAPAAVVGVGPRQQRPVAQKPKKKKKGGGKW